MVHKDDPTILKSEGDGISNGLSSETNGIPSKLKSGSDSNNENKGNCDSPVNGKSGNGTSSPDSNSPNSPGPEEINKSPVMDENFLSKNGDTGSFVNGNEEKEPDNISLPCDNPDDDLSRLDKSIIDFMENSSQDDSHDTDVRAPIVAMDDVSKGPGEAAPVQETNKNSSKEQNVENLLVENESKDGEAPLVSENGPKNGEDTSVDGRNNIPLKDEGSRSSAAVDEDASVDAISVSGDSSGSQDTSSKSQSVSPVPGHNVNSSIPNKGKDVNNVDNGCQVEVISPDKNINKIGTVLGVTQTTSVASDGMRPMAKILFETGLDMVRQNVYKDLIKIQTKKHNQEKLDVKEAKQLIKLKEAYDHLITKNEPYVLDSNKACSECGLNADLDSVIELHMEYSHQYQPNRYKCSYCNFETTMPGAFFYHMEAEHNKKGRIHAPLANYSCSYCSFESNQKNHFLKHIVKCQKQFNISRNLEPSPADCDIPLKVNKEPTGSTVELLKKSGSATSALAMHLRPNPAAVNTKNASNQAVVSTSQVINGGASGSIPGNTPQRVVQMGGQFYSLVYQGTQAFLTPLTSGVGAAAMPQMISPANVAMPQQNTGVKQAPAGQSIQQLAQKTVETVLANAAKANSTIQSVTPPQPASVSKVGDSQFEICEICGGFVKDRETLRVHFLWSHKVDLHPVVLQRKQPSLPCKECSERFWTHQGLQRHVGITHSKSSVKGVSIKPHAALKCPMQGCSGNQITDMVSHFHLTHSTLCNALIPRKRCIICFSDCQTLLKLEEHMTTTHSEYINSVFALGRLFQLYCPKGAEQYRKDKRITDSPKGGAKLLNANSTQRVITCTRCKLELHGLEAGKKHFYGAHGHIHDTCPICNENLPIGYPYVTHIQIKHCKALKIKMQRLPKGVTEKYSMGGSQERNPKTTCRKTTGKHKNKITDYSENKQDGDPTEPPLKKARTVMVDGDPVDIIEEVEDEDANKVDKQCSDKSADSKTIEEVMEIDGETVIVQQQVDDDECDN